MRSRDKFSLHKIEMENKTWVEMRLKWWKRMEEGGGPTIVPSFEDLYRIIRAICDAEDAKYPHGRGRWMVADFLQACCVPGMEWEELSEIYQLPPRTRE